MHIETNQPCSSLILLETLRKQTEYIRDVRGGGGGGQDYNRGYEGLSSSHSLGAEIAGCLVC